MFRRRFIIMTALLCAVLTATAQERKIQNKPYIDLRPMHFGILVGMNLQDIEFENVGPHVLADLRLSQHLNLRFSPTMHFGAKHLTFRNLTETDQEGRQTEVTQDMKNTYISLPIDLKFSAERWNNYRPYLMAGVNPTLNLTSKNQEYIQLKRADLFLEVGLGVDLYLPFFKLIPELKFCWSLRDALDHDHANELQDVNQRKYTNAVANGYSKMIVLTFYFE